MDTDAERWRVLLVRLGSHEAELAEDYLDRTGRGAQYYEGMVADEDLRTSARRAFRHLLQTLLGQPLGAELAAFPRLVGARRARQGVALENLTAAVRSDFMVAWSWLVRHADERDMRVMAAHVEDLWQAVDGFASQIQMGYLDEQIALARSNLRDQHQLLAQVFGGNCATRRRAETIGSALGLAPDDRFHVVVAVAAEAPVAAERWLSAANHPHVTHDHEGHPALLLAATGRWRSPDAVVTDLLDGVPCAVGPLAHGLADVGRSAAVALTLVGAAGGPPDRPVTLRTGWRALALAELVHVAEPLQELVLGPLAGSADQDVLVTTVAAYLRAGSVTGAAKLAYCHRNTVLNRMRRFAELTDLDLRKPADITLASLALLPAPDRSSTGER